MSGIAGSLAPARADPTAGTMAGARGAAHLLIVSFGYEPLAHVSAKRPSRMARELAALGLDVTVLTVDWRRERPAQPRPIGEAVAEALAAPAPRVVAVDGRLCDPAFDPDRLPRTTEPAGPRHPWLRRARTLADTLGWGAYPRWARLAHRAALALHRARPVAVTWAIHGDNSSHAIAFRLRRAAGIPWIADFKDPWSLFFPPYARPVQRWATRRRLRTAALLTETCAAQAAADAAAFGRPAEVVYSGYDADAMAAATPERPGGGYAVAYLGTLGEQHDGGFLRGVFGALARRGTLERGDVRIHQYARTSGQIRRLLAGAVPEGSVVDHDWVDERRAFGLMKGADLLLLLPPSRGAGRLVGVKELEYFASGTPVLHCGAPLDELLPAVGACPQVRVARTPEEGVAAFEDELVRRRRGALNDPALAAFTWSAQAQRLARVIAGTARPRAPDPGARCP